LRTAVREIANGASRLAKDLHERGDLPPLLLADGFMGAEKVAATLTKLANKLVGSSRPDRRGQREEPPA
jgi:hypothetical protein